MLNEQLNTLEPQYTQRNNIRIFGVPEEANEKVEILQKKVVKPQEEGDKLKIPIDTTHCGTKSQKAGHFLVREFVLCLLPDAIDLLLQPKTRTDKNEVDKDEVVENEVDDDEHDLIWDSDDAEELFIVMCKRYLAALAQDRAFPRSKQVVVSPSSGIPSAEFQEIIICRGGAGVLGGVSYVGRSTSTDRVDLAVVSANEDVGRWQGKPTAR
ncbi:hypothetical protein ILUMI_08439 [Ignelater luminosus]|uniref:Uncharacterized protein n=1 Tax=Ignelater luminosus TaxID=2038154 RepID=A0A8K0D644_IGNLU|nr:hypothetical protein ILUMI_08439 [Ignelater luminosus]